MFHIDARVIPTTLPSSCSLRGSGTATDFSSHYINGEVGRICQLFPDNSYLVDFEESGVAASFREEHLKLAFNHAAGQLFPIGSFVKPDFVPGDLHPSPDLLGIIIDWIPSLRQAEAQYLVRVRGMSGHLGGSARQALYSGEENLWWYSESALAYIPATEETVSIFPSMNQGTLTDIDLGGLATVRLDSNTIIDVSLKDIRPIPESTDFMIGTSQGTPRWTEDARSTSRRPNPERRDPPPRTEIPPLFQRGDRVFVPLHVGEEFLPADFRDEIQATVINPVSRQLIFVMFDEAIGRRVPEDFDESMIPEEYRTRECNGKFWTFHQMHLDFVDPATAEGRSQPSEKKVRCPRLRRQRNLPPL